MRQNMTVMDSTKAVLKRFPNLKDEVSKLASQDTDFRQLCRDYADLSRALDRQSDKETDHLDELQTLKSLEVEILERVFRRR